MASIQKLKDGDGRNRYKVQVRRKGVRTQTARFDRKRDAEGWAAQQEAAIQENRHFRSAEAKRRTVADLIDRYEKSVLPQKRSQEHQRRQLERWREELGHIVLAELTPGAVAEARDNIAADTVRGDRKRSPGSVNRYLAALGHALKVGAEEWGWLEHSPMSSVRKLKEPKGRVRYLNETERVRLLNACKESREPLLYPIVLIAMLTGMRKGELLSLTWDQVDLERSRVILHDTKNDERRPVSLPRPAREQLEPLQADATSDAVYVFPNADGTKPIDIRAAWEAARELAGLQDFRFHDLRHTTASYLAMNNASVAEIAAVLGHKSLQMTQRYAHLSEQHAADVVERMSQEVMPTDRNTEEL
ncbi:integrase [Rhodovibrio sodomensis]|uniref:Integrase n=1 Tax=Rhodovibrio sodomensis TaxID=1088 RepID=A0ABS1DJ40_9PROT|nr:site-specific integrase [Rhodovibrio sodomensis]MBK1670016.1 integrase [Rhodovibrio sodomensis]